MTRQAKITEIVEKVSSQPLVVGPDESLFESGVLDSFALTDMVGALEDMFSIRIPDSDLAPRTSSPLRASKLTSTRGLDRYGLIAGIRRLSAFSYSG